MNAWVFYLNACFEIIKGSSYGQLIELDKLFIFVKLTQFLSVATYPDKNNEERNGKKGKPEIS
jgi:hypothetical protein